MSDCITYNLDIGLFLYEQLFQIEIKYSFFMLHSC